jgi:hypothetical protein
MKELVVLKYADTSAATLRQEVKQALAAAKLNTFQQKDKYEAELREVVNNLDDRIDQLEADAKAEVKAKLQEQIAALKK